MRNYSESEKSWREKAGSGNQGDASHPICKKTGVYGRIIAGMSVIHPTSSIVTFFSFSVFSSFFHELIHWFCCQSRGETLHSAV